MRVVYEPVDLLDAHLVKGALEADGLPVYLRGEHLAGGIGGVPVIGLYALCVPEFCAAAALVRVASLLAARDDSSVADAGGAAAADWQGGVRA